MESFGYLHKQTKYHKFVADVKEYYQKKLENFLKNFEKAELDLSMDETLELFIDNKNTVKFAEERIDEFFYDWYQSLNSGKIEELEQQLIYQRNQIDECKEVKMKNEKITDLILLIEEEKEKLLQSISDLSQQIKEGRQNSLCHSQDQEVKDFLNNFKRMKKLYLVFSSKKNSKIQSLLNKISQLEEKMETSQSDKKFLLHSNKTLQEELNNLKQNCKETWQLQEENKILEDSSLKHHRQCDALKTLLAESKKKHVQTMKELQSRMSRTVSQLQSLHEAVFHTQKKLDRLTSMVQTSLEADKEKIKELASKNDSMQKKLKKAEKQRDFYMQNSPDNIMASPLEKFEDVNQENKAINQISEQRELDEKIYILRFKHEDILESEISKLKEDLLQKFKKKENLVKIQMEQELEFKLQQERDKTKEMVREMELVQKVLEEERQKHSHVLSNMQMEADSSQLRKQEWEQENQSLQKTVEKLEEKVEQSMNLLQEQKSKEIDQSLLVSQLKQNIQDLNDHITQLEEDKEDLATKISTKEAEIGQIKVERQELSQKLQKSEVKSLNLLENLEQNKKVELSLANEQQQKQIEQLTFKVTSLQLENTKQEEAKKELRNHINKLTEKFEKISCKKLKTKEKVRELKTMIKQKSKDCETFEARTQQSSQSMLLLVKNVKMIKHQLKAFQKNLLDVFSQVNGKCEEIKKSLTLKIQTLFQKMLTNQKNEHSKRESLLNQRLLRIQKDYQEIVASIEELNQTSDAERNILLQKLKQKQMQIEESQKMQQDLQEQIQENETQKEELANICLRMKETLSAQAQKTKHHEQELTQKDLKITQLQEEVKDAKKREARLNQKIEEDTQESSSKFRKLKTDFEEKLNSYKRILNSQKSDLEMEKLRIGKSDAEY